MYKRTVENINVIELEEILIFGRFIGEESDYHLFQELKVSTSEVLDVWKVKKSNFRGQPPMNISGYLQLDDSYFPKEIDGEWYITEGSGRLITFIPNPF